MAAKPSFTPPAVQPVSADGVGKGGITHKSRDGPTQSVALTHVLCHDDKGVTPVADVYHGIIKCNFEIEQNGAVVYHHNPSATGHSVTQLCLYAAHDSRYPGTAVLVNG